MQHYTWELPRTSLDLGPRTLLMGILNVTPDSFSDGGLFNDAARAVDHALELEEEGADILDIGGESTRPDGPIVDEADELRRVMPALESIANEVRIPISIDTYRSATARHALESGAQIINDISGFRLDPKLYDVALETGAGVVLMHSRGNRNDIHVRPDTDDPEFIRDELAATIQEALDRGIPRQRIVADPGIGFSKTRATSLKVLKRLDLFSTLDCPLLVGPSRKSFIRLDIPVSDAAAWATAAAVSLAIAQGAHIIRVHEVARMRVVAAIADSVRNA
jgi:dihydropteroate synthase